MRFDRTLKSDDCFSVHYHVPKERVQSRDSNPKLTIRVLCLHNSANQLCLLNCLLVYLPASDDLGVPFCKVLILIPHPNTHAAPTIIISDTNTIFTTASIINSDVLMKFLRGKNDDYDVEIPFQRNKNQPTKKKKKS